MGKAEGMGVGVGKRNNLEKLCVRENSLLKN